MAYNIDLLSRKFALDAEDERRGAAYREDKLQDRLQTIDSIKNMLTSAISTGSKIKGQIDADAAAKAEGKQAGAIEIEGTDLFAYKTGSDNVVTMTSADIKEFNKARKFGGQDFNPDSIFEYDDGTLREVWRPSLDDKSVEVHKKAIKSFYPADAEGNEWVKGMDTDAWSQRFDVDWSDEQWDQFFGGELSKKNQADLEEAFTDIDIADLAENNKDLMSTYGTTDPQEIQNYLQGASTLSSFQDASGSPQAFDVSDIADAKELDEDLFGYDDDLGDFYDLTDRQQKNVIKDRKSSIMKDWLESPESKGTQYNPYTTAERKAMFQDAKDEKELTNFLYGDDPELEEFYKLSKEDQRAEIIKRQKLGQEKYESDELWAAFDEQDQEEKLKSDADLTERYGTLDPKAIQETLRNEYYEELDLEQDLYGSSDLETLAFENMSLKDQKKYIEDKKSLAMENFMKDPRSKGTKYNPYTMEERQEMWDQAQDNKETTEYLYDYDENLKEFYALSDKDQAKVIEQNKINVYGEFLEEAFDAQELNYKNFESLSPEEQKFTIERNKQKVLRKIKQSDRMDQLETEMIQKYGDIGMDKIHKIILEEMYLEFPNFDPRTREY